MLSVGPDIYEELTGMASERGISIQELLRAIVLPEWLGCRGDSAPVAKPGNIRVGILSNQ
jgi:hypothetical protein